MWPLDGSFDSIWFRLLFYMVSFISLKDCSRLICASICVMEKCLFHGGSYWISGAVCHRGTNWPILSEFGNVIWISVTIRTSVMRDKLNGYWPPCVRESQNPQSHMLHNFPFCSSLTAFPVTLQMDLLQVLIRWPHWLRLPAVCHSSPVVLILHFCSSPMASCYSREQCDSASFLPQLSMWRCGRGNWKFSSWIVLKFSPVFAYY